MFRSVLDNDLYKFTQQQIVLDMYPNVRCQYKFINRRKTDKFNSKFLELFEEKILSHHMLYLTHEELEYLESLPYFKKSYISFLWNRTLLNKNHINYCVNADGDLELTIDGLWVDTILWEVPLMAIISESFYESNILENQSPNNNDLQVKQANRKGNWLNSSNVKWADFGTRRRRSSLHQKIIVEEMSKFKPNFLGTSNVYLAKEYNCNPIGTVAHEWTMGTSALKSLRKANYFALKDWAEFYKGQLGIALTDTYGSDAFFKDFNLELAKLYDGVRQDSGSPDEFAKKAISHYKNLNIDPKTKTIVFSDSLDVILACELNKNWNDKINCVFGIGTHFTNDCPDKHALNMVIKLNSVDDIPVVKLSDVVSKACGDEDAVKVAKWTHLGSSLEE